MKLTKCTINETYIINNIQTSDKNIEDFLWSLGCFPGENISIVSKLSANYIVYIKDAKYSIDEALAKCIEVEKNTNS